MENLLIKIFELYGLRLELVEKVTKGFLSENFILRDTNKKYFLKKYRFSDRERIEEIHRVKKYFSNGGIPAILPFTTQGENSFFTQNNAHYALFPFVNGKQYERGELKEDRVESLGETLGRIHRLGKESRLNMRKEFTEWSKVESLETLARIGEEIKKKPLPTEFDILAMESIALKKHLISLNVLMYEDLKLQNDHLIHGDYLDHNVFFGADNRVSYVFDFEKTLHSPRVYELFRSFMYVFLSGAVSSENLMKAKKYLDAYASVYPISKNELLRGLKLFYLKSIHGAWVESEHYLKHNTRVDCFLYLDYMRIKFLSEHLNIVEDMLAQS